MLVKVEGCSKTNEQYSGLFNTIYLLMLLMEQGIFYNDQEVKVINIDT